MLESCRPVGLSAANPSKSGIAAGRTAQSGRRAGREAPMLIEFCAQNHRAIREKQLFSMIPLEADDIDRLNWPYHVAKTGHPAIPRILIDACLLGANGSGKTSFVDAMRFMTDFVRNSFNMSPTTNIPSKPFILHQDWADQSSGVEATFICGDTIYQYGFEVTQDQVLDEWLRIRTAKSKRWTVLFDREWNSKSGDYKLTFDRSLKDVAAVIQKMTRPDALLLSTAVLINVRGHVETAYRWLAESFQIRFLTDGKDIDDTVGLLKEDGGKEKILDYFQDFGISLRNIGIEKRKLVRTLRPGTSSHSRNGAAGRNASKNEEIVVFFVRDAQTTSPVPIPLESESSGTRELFELAGPIIDALENGRTIVVDELSPGLHPVAFENLVAMFCDPETNTKDAQIIFTTRDPTIVQATFVERDQVWLMDKKDGDWAARLTQLPNLEGSKGLVNFADDYLQGQYGCIPEIRRQL